MPEWIREFREEIIKAIESGKTAEQVFNEIIDQVNEALDAA